jgi:hypothetical protein
VKIAYPIASVPAGFTGTLMMLVDNDSTFATGATAYTGTLNAGNWEFTVDVTDMTYMTFAKVIPTDTTPPVISGSSIASGTLVPIGNFALTYNYSDTGSAIAPATATGQIYSWNSGTLSYNASSLNDEYSESSVWTLSLRSEYRGHSGEYIYTEFYIFCRCDRVDNQCRYL